MKFDYILGILALTGSMAACDDGSMAQPDDGASGGTASTGGGTSTGGGATDGDGGGELAKADVCGFAGVAALPEADAEGFRDVAATHPALWYAGRLDCMGADGPTFSFPGALVRVRFRGTALSVRLKDGGKGSATATNYYDVSIDGAEPTVLEAVAGESEYALASGLSDGEHQVVLAKRTEASPGGSPNAGTGAVLGFRLQGSELMQATGPARRLEFVGDSITCGYGVELSTTTPDDFHFTTKNENGRKAYGALTAQLLGAEYSGVAYSGKGMSRNYAGGAGETVPQFYLDTVPDDTTASVWDPTRYVPQAIVINVGTNDFSTVGVDRELYVASYTTFLETLRGYYPDAALVAALGPMLSDFYPEGANAWTNAQADVKAAIDARHAAGDMNVHSLVFPPQKSPYGEDWHPSAATQQAMADATAELLRGVLGWE